MPERFTPYFSRSAEEQSAISPLLELSGMSPIINELEIGEPLWEFRWGDER
jgi:hypothetical protein